LVLLDIQVNPGSSGSPVFVRTDVGIAKLLGVAFEYQPGNDWVLRINPSGHPYWANVNTGLARVVTLFELARYAQPH
jgi:hypothetical protein